MDKTLKCLKIGIFILTLSASILSENQPTQSNDQNNSTELSAKREQAEIEYYQAETDKLHEKSYLSDTMIGGLIAILSVILGVSISYILEKRKISLYKIKLYEKQKDAVELTIKELLNCLTPLLKYWEKNNIPPPFMDINLVFEQPVGSRATNLQEPFFQKYLLLRLIYLLCSLFGWLELYRQDSHFLEIKRDHKTELIIDKIRLCLSYLFNLSNTLKDSTQKLINNDTVILVEEQRAIGEKMLIPFKDSFIIMGYATFCEKLFKLPERSFDYRKYAPNEKDQDFWIFIVTGFLASGLIPDSLRQERGKNDFRLQRLTFLAIHLIELMNHLNNKKYIDEKKINNQSLSGLQDEWKSILNKNIQFYRQNGLNDVANQMDNLLKENMELIFEKILPN